MQEQNISQAAVSKKREFSPVWIVPLIAVLIGCWMIFQYVNSRGPQITLILPDAQGIEAGKTSIKSRNVHVGTISEVELSENYDHIIATVQMDKNTERMLNVDSQFWIVEPHVGADGISGLETILSGSYIELKPGNAKQSKREFKVLDSAPVAGPDTEGIRVVLTHHKANQLKAGDPVLHNGFLVGRVEKSSFDYKNNQATYQLFIYAPYDGLLFEKTQFWLDSGVSVKFGVNGLDVNFTSLENILTGGVSFGVAENIAPGKQNSTNMQGHKLYDSYDLVLQGRYTTNVKYVLLFEESVRGLTAGAPVEYRGIRIGTVDTVPLHIITDQKGRFSTRIPVLIKIETERLTEVFGNTNEALVSRYVKEQLSNGLRATLKPGNLLTGALFVDIDFYEDVESQQLSQYAGYDVFPVVSGGLVRIQKQVTDFLSKINDLPIDKTLANANSAIVTLNKTLNSLDKLLSNQDTQNLPEQANDAVKSLQNTLQSYNSDSALYQDLSNTSEQLDESLQELQRVLKEARPLIKLLEDKPNALVFGEDEAEDPVPAKGAL